MTRTVHLYFESFETRWEIIDSRNCRNYYIKMLHILYTSMKQYSSYIIQLMTLDEVNTMIYQLQRFDYHRGQAEVIIRSLGLRNHGINWNPKSSIVLLYENLNLVIYFFFTVIVITHKKNAVPQGNTWASLLSTCDFQWKINKIQNKQNVTKRKTTWGRHKTRRCITSCC